MLWGVIVVLIVLWLLGWLAFHIAGGLIHILLIIAIIVFIYKIITDRRSL